MIVKGFFVALQYKVELFFFVEDFFIKCNLVEMFFFFHKASLCSEIIKNLIFK